MDNGWEGCMVTNWTNGWMGEDWAARTTAAKASRRSVIRRPLKSGLEAAESALGPITERTTSLLSAPSAHWRGTEWTTSPASTQSARWRLTERTTSLASTQCARWRLTERTAGSVNTQSACWRRTLDGRTGNLVIWTSERTELRGKFEAEDGSDCPSRLSSRVVVGQAPEGYVRVAKFGVGQENIIRSPSDS
uniref:Uncharacterized protein n=1 Tax=Phytophthora fragariae TaxID=53985 RepID=A0A6A3DGF3_9STRA|nr:hypothetical protein PF009_g28748 [Phytophthora fragariae]